MAGKKTLGLLETGIEVRQPFHDRRPRHDDKARIGARPKHERLALADDARHVGLRSLRDSDWLTKCAKMVNGWLIIILPRDSGEGGPPCAAGWWKGRGPRRNLDNARLSADLELDESFVRFHRPATTTKLRVLRPLHHGSLAARAPVVPLPPLSRGRKEKRSRSRDACAPEACRPKPRILSPHRKRREAERRKGATVSWGLATHRMLPSVLRFGRGRAFSGTRSPFGAPPRRSP